MDVLPGRSILPIPVEKEMNALYKMAETAQENSETAQENYVLR